MFPVFRGNSTSAHALFQANKTNKLWFSLGKEKQEKGENRLKVQKNFDSRKQTKTSLCVTYVEGTTVINTID